VEKRESGREEGNFFSIHLREKSSEGKSPRAWGAERGSQGYGNEDRQEGSQTLKTRLPRFKATSGGRFFERRSEKKKGFQI
jgi:hypothetical protein